MDTVIGLFDEFAHAKSAALALESLGIRHTEISIVANREGSQYAPTGPHETHQDAVHAAEHEAVVGAEIVGLTGLFLGLTAFTVPGIGWLVGAGWLLGVGVGIGALAGGLIGALTHAGVPHAQAAVYQEALRRGGTLVAVKAKENMVGRIEEVLRAHGAVNIEERAAAYEQEGFVREGPADLHSPEDQTEKPS